VRNDDVVYFYGLYDCLWVECIGVSDVDGHVFVDFVVVVCCVVDEEVVFVG